MLGLSGPRMVNMKRNAYSVYSYSIIASRGPVSQYALAGRGKAARKLSLPINEPHHLNFGSGGNSPCALQSADV